MKAHALDQFDFAILEILGSEGRISLTDLAVRVGLSKSPVQARVKRLEQSGVIKGYRALIDPVRLNREHVAFVEVKLADTREAALDAFNRAVQRIVEVEQCHMIAGDFDYLLKVRTADMVAYRDVLGTRISLLPHVAQTSTFVAMQSIKDAALTG